MNVQETPKLGGISGPVSCPALEKKDSKDRCLTQGLRDARHRQFASKSVQRGERHELNWLQALVSCRGLKVLGPSPTSSWNGSLQDQVQEETKTKPNVIRMGKGKAIRNSRKSEDLHKKFNKPGARKGWREESLCGLGRLRAPHSVLSRPGGVQM